MLVAASFAWTGATTVGLTMGFVAYEHTESALIVAIVVSAFGLAFAISLRTRTRCRPVAGA
jgi:hypothetical protein